MRFLRYLLSLLIFLPAMVLGFSCDEVTEIPTIECKALVALYDSSDGINWTSNKNWKLTNTPCSWFGVDCGGGNQVIALRLPANGLKGNITDLSALQNMWSLQLSQNRLTGNIAWLSQLTNLQSVELQENREHLDDLWCSRTSNQVIEQTVNKGLSGTIPDLGNLTGLHNFKVYNNSFTDSIPDVSNLTNLVDFRLQGNNLSGDIPDLQGLNELKFLHLNCNILTGGIPIEVNNLVNSEDNNPLIEISLGSNPELGGTIPDLSNLVNLERLELGINNLIGQIPSLTTLKKLKTLALYNNQLDGQIPSELSGLTNLVEVYLYRNNLTGSIPDLSNLINLQKLNVHSNNLSGPIPELGNSSELTYFQLQLPAQTSNLLLCKISGGNYLPIQETVIGHFPMCQVGEYNLVVTVDNNGKVTGNDIDCGSICTKEYPVDTQISLTAIPNVDYQFYIVTFLQTYTII